MAQGYVQDIAKYDGVVNQYHVSISPIVTCDIKDGRVRVTYSVPLLDVVRLEGGRRGDKDNPPILPEVHNEQWQIEYCYPLYKKDEHKRASSKALVMTCISRVSCSSDDVPQQSRKGDEEWQMKSYLNPR